MAIVPAEQYAIAAGLNVPYGSLVNIELILPGGDEYFAGPKALPLYDDGEVDPILDGDLQERGYASVTWFFTRLTYAQYSYLKTTYCNGGLSGDVTIYTTLGDTTFYRMNAKIHLKKPKDLRSEYRYQDAEVLFVKLGLAA